MWDLAISAQVLPFTLLLIPVALYWLLAGLGAVDLDMFNVDFDTDLDVDVDADPGAMDGGEHGHAHSAGLGLFQSALKAVNATDVPLMLVLSIFFIMMWVCAMLGNLWFNAEGGNFLGTMVGLGTIVAGLVLTRLLTEPLKPLFRAMKGTGSEHRPVVGRSGIVRTAELTDRVGQVEIKEGGEVILLNARLKEGAVPLKRGSEVIVYAYDEDSGIYHVKNLTTS